MGRRPEEGLGRCPLRGGYALRNRVSKVGAEEQLWLRLDQVGSGSAGSVCLRRNDGLENISARIIKDATINPDHFRERTINVIDVA